VPAEARVFIHGRGRLSRPCERRAVQCLRRRPKALPRAAWAAHPPPSAIRVLLIDRDTRFAHWSGAAGRISPAGTLRSLSATAGSATPPGGRANQGAAPALPIGPAPPQPNACAPGPCLVISCRRALPVSSLAMLAFQATGGRAQQPSRLDNRTAMGWESCAAYPIVEGDRGGRSVALDLVRQRALCTWAMAPQCGSRQRDRQQFRRDLIRAAATTARVRGIGEDSGRTERR